jgi:membrane-associated phospholipid phosphatase
LRQNKGLTAQCAGKTMNLPLFLTRKNKYLAGALMYAMGYTLYYLTNHYPTFEPKQLPMLWVDQNTPFLPYTVLIYISEYFYFAFVYILLSQYNNINKYLYSFFFLQLFSCTIFLAYPTIYPRELFPVPTDLPLWLQSTWAWLRKVDSPTNCFPSLHVSSVYLSAFVFRTDGQKKTFWVFFTWATLIALSTLTTKQHYVADILSGVSLAGLFYWWFHHKQEYKRVYPMTANNEVVA